MLYRYSEIFRTAMFVADMTLVAGSWLAAYWLRFYAGFEAPHGVPDLNAYFQPLALILPLWAFLFRGRGLYEPQRTGSLLRESTSVVRATVTGVVVLVAVTFFARSYFYSRGVIAIFFVFSTTSVATFRLFGRLVLRSLRRRGMNQRYVLVLGDGPLVGQVITRLHDHPESGLQVLGILSESGFAHSGRVCGVPVLGSYCQLKETLDGNHRIDQVILALPRQGGSDLEKILADLDDEMVTIRLVPDLLHVMTLRSSVENLEGLPIINLRDSPLVGWSAVSKRAFDMVVSACALLVGAPLLGLIALLTRVFAGGPIIFSQQRMGLDGRVFRMFKFRTMMVDAEVETGPVWAQKRDPRRTRLGGFLRRSSLDELPQLWNVLRGEMSLVGPRPERPVFIQQFRREIPGYMLRHKVKAGLTGWAQVRGWRGDTSLRERVEHDIYYIQNWSLRLDIRILFMTLWKGWFNRNAY
jgi:Undecaprenyl-phosphate glucose phosphotransferase